jgi:hypothetical protein
MNFSRLHCVLSGFTTHLTSHFGKSFSSHSYRYDFSNDLPNCFASYAVKPDPWCNMRAMPVQLRFTWAE